jgi:glycolate oxidase FAD binding subunit
VTAAVPDLGAMQLLLGEILDAQLVPAAVQVRVGAAAPQIDVQFEGTEEGIYAQVDRLREMTPLTENDAEVFQRLDAGAKISVLPARIAETLEGLDGYAVVEATGIGWVQSPHLAQMREKIESMGGSLVLMRPYNSLDAWGNTAGGDALPLMRTIKQRFDPRGILNPGVFVGGI